MTSDTSQLNTRKIRIFNPHRLNDAELEQSFIARQETFRVIFDNGG